MINNLHYAIINESFYTIEKFLFYDLSSTTHGGALNLDNQSNKNTENVYIIFFIYIMIIEYIWAT